MGKSINAKILFIVAGLMFAGFIVSTSSQKHDYAGWLLMACFVFIALAFRGYELMKGYSFTVMIFAAVTVAMYHPHYFVYAGDFKLSKLIVPLMQILMFGMGTALSLADFSRVLKMPQGVVVGIVCQYSIMPLIGWTLTKMFSFPPEIAAGVILIGSCPSGLASNVMSYLAKANLALSVTLTAIVTLLAPLMTPLFMKLLAGQYVVIDFWSMVWDITKIIILPIGAGLVFNHFVRGKFRILDKVMPVISMASIALIITIITAAGRNDLLVVGPLLILAALIHNLSGYFLGYWSARLMRLREQDCRTVALEVGLQNGGLASSLALSMGKLATVGLASAVFAPIMNITGSTLALWWRSHTSDIPQTSEYMVNETQNK
jgi:bile acid:Na+ symporter, BASS family